MATIVTMISDSYEATEATMTHMNNIKLAPFDIKIPQNAM